MVYVVRLLFLAGMCDQWHVPDGCYVCTWVYERVVFYAVEDDLEVHDDGEAQVVLHM